MARTNKAVKTSPIYTHEGGRAARANAEQLLRRSVMSCLLWENEFYEDGESISARIAGLVPLVKPEKVAEMAIDAREKMKLRHVPLWIVRNMAALPTHKGLVRETLSRIIQRADELSEFVALYWKEKRQPLSAQCKKGLAAAFPKFSEYDLAKYNRDTTVKLRDVLFLCHAKPKDQDQADVWQRLIDGTLTTPDTWEVALSSGANKKESWERLLKEKKLGALALIRNLRNFHEAGVDESLVVGAIETMKVERVLPFRFISAARYAPQLEPALEAAMLKCLGGREKLPGHTVLLVDVSGSMDVQVSEKSDITRLEAACGVAMLAREICEKVDIFTFSDKLVQIPARRGFALRDKINDSQNHSGTPLGLAVKSIYAETSFRETGHIYRGHTNVGDYQGQNLQPDRLIIITDEQSHDPVPSPIGKGYMINVASNQNGVGYGAWLHIDGWSEAVLDYVVELERAGTSLE